MTAEDTAEPTLAITEQAIERVRGFRAQSEDPESQALWVEVSGVSDGEYLYKISLNALHVAHQGDVVQRHGDLAIVVRRVERREAARCHHRVVGGSREERPRPREPQQQAAGSGGAADDEPRDGAAREPAHRCSATRRPQRRPRPAGHPGDRPADSTRPSPRTGGARSRSRSRRTPPTCAWAAAARAAGWPPSPSARGSRSRSPGAVPEIARVVDVTEHAAGTNPYFEPAKKVGAATGTRVVRASSGRWRRRDWSTRRLRLHPFVPPTVQPFNSERRPRRGTMGSPGTLRDASACVPCRLGTERIRPLGRTRSNVRAS